MEFTTGELDDLYHRARQATHDADDIETAMRYDRLANALDDLIDVPAMSEFVPK